MAKLFLIGDEDTVLGFRLAGVRGHVVKDTGEATDVFRKAAEDQEVSIIVITERIAEKIRPEIEHHMETGAMPFVVEIADSQGPAPTRKSPSDLVREAIGISI